MAGYSATPLAKKLGLAPGCHVGLINAPDTFLPLLDPLPEGTYFWGVYLDDVLPYPMFLAPRELSVEKAAAEPVTAPNTIKDWGK